MPTEQPLDLKKLSGKLTAASTAVGEVDRSGELVMKAGRICRPVWKIRDVARPGIKETEYLSLNDAVFVERSQLGRPGDTQSWLYVYARPGNGARVAAGWVNSAGVLMDAPEPEAKVEYIAGRTKLIDIAAKHYKPAGGFGWNEDARFFVAALAYVNRNYEAIIPSGLTDADFLQRGRWADIGVKADHAIWIPKRELLIPLKGRFVSSGSISYELLMTIGKVAAHAWEAVVGVAAFAAGLIHGVLLSVYDTLMDIVELVQLVWKVLRSIVMGDLINDAKQLWDTLKEIDWRQAIGQFAGEFMAKWEADNTWARCYFQGQVVGYIIGLAAMTVLTAGIAAALKAAGTTGKAVTILNKIANNAVVKKIMQNPAVRKVADKAEEALKKSKELQEQFSAWKARQALKKQPPFFEVLDDTAPTIGNTSILEHLRLRVGKREWLVQRNKHKLGPDGKPIGPTTKHMAEKAAEANGFAKGSKVDFPISSLAGALEEAEKRLLANTARSGELFKVEGWELGINTQGNVWTVYHALYNPAFK